jgi:hypothetical protein
MSTTVLAPPAGELYRAAGELFAVPEPYRAADVGRAEAGQLLGCDDDTLTRLIGLGLPALGVPGGELFDARDIFNLGLDSGTGLAGQMFRLALRWMRGSDEALIAQRRSTVTIDVACPAAGCCGDGPRTRLAVPVPEYHGGVTEELTVDGPGTVTGGTAVAEASTLRITTTVRTRGEIVPLYATGAREAMREFLGAGLRWIRMPEALGADVALMLERGVASCAAAALWVTAMCHDAGVSATTRSGWVAGMDLHHAWVEVVDDDGVTKVIDPVLGLFAQLVPGVNPAFGDPARSVRTGRLIPTALPAGAPPARHRCGDRDVPVRPAVTLTSRPLA